MVRYNKGPDSLVFHAVAGEEYIFKAIDGIGHPAWDYMLIVNGAKIRSTPVPGQ